MSGYFNYSMSNNAKDCYERGIMPYTKWTKEDILNALKDYDINVDVFNALAKLNTNQLRYVCLSYSEWHHTSNHYNKTDFYSINDYIVDLTLDNLKDMLINFENDKQEKEVKKNTEKKARCKYLAWEGSRKHPKAKELEDIGIIKGDWFYLPNGKKKSINAKGFKIVEYLD